MYKNLKKNREIENPDIFVVLNPKGGVGKSAISKYMLPAIMVHENPTKRINVYEIDNNNAATHSPFVNGIVNYKKFKINNKNEAIFDLEFSVASDEYAIVDCGGGDDVQAVLEGLKDIKLTDVNYIIPTNDDDEQFENVVDTINKILLINAEASIRLVFNRVHSDSGVEKQFVAFFGDKELGLENSLTKIEKYITWVSIVPQTNILYFLKNVLKKPLADYYIHSKIIVENIEKLKKEWMAEAKEAGDGSIYHQKLNDLTTATKAVDFVNLLATKYFKL